MINPALRLLFSRCERSDLERILAPMLKKGNLALVLGAGASAHFRLPGWDGLVRRLFLRSGKKRPARQTVEQQAEFFKNEVCRGRQDRYLAAVRQALYGARPKDGWDLRSSRLLAAVASLVNASSRGSVADVVTFNFDDYLERYLEYHGLVVQSIIDETTKRANPDVTIYHPHGLVCLDARRPGSDDIVFTREDFSRVVGRDIGLWRKELMTVLSRRFCLFIGVSGDDPNLDSLLVEVKNHRNSSGCEEPWGVRFSIKNPRHTDEKARRTAWKTRGVVTLQVKNYEKDLPDFMFNICQRAANL